MQIQSKQAQSTASFFSSRHQRGRRPHSASVPLLPSGRERRRPASKERDEEDNWTSSDNSDVVAAKESGWKNWDAKQAPPAEDVDALQASRLKGKLRARELAELRRLVQHDERFSQVLDRHCQAIHELVASGNPSPVLALLAGLVWGSLCIAWEVAGASGSMPKARLRAKLVQAEEELAKVKDNLHKSRCFYLKELTALRDQVRRLSAAAETEVANLVHEEEPVMFYEPLNYISDDVKAHVVEIVQEKMKLAVQRLQLSGNASVIAETSFEAQVQNEKKTEKDKEKEEREKEEESWEAKRKAEERSEALRKEQADMEVARRRKERAAQAEAAMKAQMKALEASARDAEGELLRRCDESEAKAEELQMVVTELKVQQQSSQVELTSILKAAKSEWEELSTAAGQKPAFTPQGVEGTGSYVGQLLKVEAEARKSLQKELQQAKTAAKDAAEKAEKAVEKAEKAEKRFQAVPKPKPQAAPEKPPDAAVEELEKEMANLRKEAEAARAEAELQRLLAEEAVAKQQKAEASAKQTAETAVASSKAAEAQPSPKPSAKSTEEQPSAKAKSSPSPDAKAREKSVLLGAENEQLRLEVDRLQQALVELQDYLRSDETSSRPSSARQASGLPKWKTSQSKVHERLYHDSVDRQARKKVLAESVHQAREDKALEIFQAKHLMLSSILDSEAGGEGIPSSPDEEGRTVNARQVFLTQADIDAGFTGNARSRGRSGSLRRQTTSPTARRSPSPRLDMKDMGANPLIIATAVAGREEPLLSHFLRRQLSTSQAGQVDDDSNVSAISASTSALAIADKPGPSSVPTWFACPPPRLRAARPSSAKSARSATSASAMSSEGSAAAGSQAGASSDALGRLRRSRPSSAVGSNPRDMQLLKEGYRLLASQPGDPSTAISVLSRSASAPGLPSRRPPSAPSLRVPR